MSQAVSILIVNYNGSSFLESCLTSFQNILLSHNITHEFLIIDNASTDNSVEEINRLAARIPELSVFFSDQNLGFSKANNLLAKRAKYDTLLLLNNDTHVLSLNNLCTLLKTNSLDPNTIYTGILLNDDHSLQKNTFNFPRISFVALDLFLIKKLIFGIYKRLVSSRIVVETGYYSGCFLVIPKSIFNGVGGFDEDFFFYHEECDLFLRLEKLDVQKQVLQDRIIHYGSGGNGITDVAFSNYYENLARVLIKHNYGSPQFIKALFKYGFYFRILLLKLKFNIPYSPLSHIYEKNKVTKNSSKHLINLHRQTLQSIKGIKVKSE